jgi:cysteine desulfurase
VAEIGAICRKHGVFFHTDAAQAVGKIPLDVNAMNIDLMSISAHKIYGPKGIGALYVRRRPRVRLQALIHGGGQERGMRSGTLATPLCVGMGEACRIAKEEMGAEAERLRGLRDRLLKGVSARLPEVYLNGDPELRIPGNLNISFAFVEGEGLMMGVKDIAVSSGSACTSASLEPSYVLRALGLDAEMAHTSLRIGIGRFTTEKDIDYAINHIVEAVSRLRELSPLWEMHLEGIDIKSIEWADH